VFARAEPDPEIQDLVAASAGLNFGLDFLPGALAFDADAGRALDPELAAAIVWFDALMTNVDRTPRNPNLLAWHGRIWLIDHGAAFYRQHGERPLASAARDAFPMIGQHVLLERAGSIGEADERLAATAVAAIDAIVRLVPDDWLGDRPAPRRQDFADFLRDRLRSPRDFVVEADDARA
jgi:hypothetical protein